MKTPTIIPSAEPFLLPGNRTGCLLVHGFTGTPFEMRWLGGQLHHQGYTVLGVRLYAHATQPQDMIRAHWKDWFSSVEDGWHLLSKITDEVFVIGLSMGGILSLLFSAHYPVAGVVAMATPHHLPNDLRMQVIKPLSILRPFRPKGTPNWFDLSAYEQHISYPADPTRSYAELRDLTKEMQAALGSITAPVLLIYSKGDQVVRAEDRHLELIYNALGSREKQYLWIENSGHVITRDAEKQTVFQATTDFIVGLTQKNP